MAETTKGTTQDDPPVEQTLTETASPPEPVPETAEVEITPQSFEETPPPPPPPRRESSGFGRFLGLVLGGALAAGGGFGLALYGTQQGWPLLTPTDKADSTVEDVQALKAGLAELRAAPAPQPDLTPFESRLTALEARAEMAAPADTTALEQKIAALEQRIASLDAGDPAAIKAEIDSQVAARMQDAKAEADAVKAEAEALRQKAEQRAAILALQTALDSGTTVPETLVRVKAAGVTLPEPLMAFVADPVTLPALRAGFDPAARAALAAVRAARQDEGTMTDRLSTFLLNQTGARSLTPREGDDADAVLSRMQARLAEGDVAGALTQAGDLPEPALAPLADWTTQAKSWLAAQDALAKLIPAE